MLGFRNTARRNGVAANIQTKFSTSPQFGQPEVSNITMRQTGDPGLSVVARFSVKADRDAMWADLDAQLGSGVNGPVSGSRAWIHDCPHDEGRGDCVLGSERVW